MKKPNHNSTPLTQILTLFSFLIACQASDTLTFNTSLTNNQTLVSSTGNFALGFFSPQNSGNRYLGIWYNKIKVQTVVWVANRDKPIANASVAASFSITSNSTISISAAGTVIWSSTASKTLHNPVLQLLDNANLVLKESDAKENNEESFAWQSFYHPTDTLLPGMKMGFNFKTGMNNTYTSWLSDSDPSPGNYYTYMDISGDPELFLMSSGNQKIWRTGPWNGEYLSGAPDTLSYNGINFTFTITPDEISYSFYVADESSALTRLVVNDTGQTGLMQRWLWIEEDEVWNMYWYAPKDQCDFFAPCGPFGVCDPNNSPICDCLPGFTPKSPSAWALRDGTAGCVRKTSLDCRNGTDGFVKVSETKLPDTTNATVDTTIGLEECRSRCLRNCSCTGYAVADIQGSGSGCVIWSSEMTDIRVYTSGGEDLYLRLAAADLDSSGGESHGRNVTVAVSVSLVLVALLLVSGGFYLWRKRKNKPENAMLVTSSFNENINSKYSRENDMELPLFEFNAILVATDSFSMVNKIGEGGFGLVYKGKLDDGQEIAVKRLAKTSSQGVDEFKNEVMLIAKLQHRNLVRLLGCCIHEEERILVYEYMPNKSLDVFLFDKTKGNKLDWQTRYSIIQGIARGLLYLHHDSRLRIIHRDLKASNILLDNKMNPKISDFGMARIFGGDESEVNTRRVVGTYGYMSPEYAMDGIFSVKSDVFSFGVLVLEIITGRKNKGVYMLTSHMNLLGHAWNSWKDGNGVEIVDESIRDYCPLDEVLKCMHIGLLCVQERPEDRPLMTAVVLMLGSDGSSLKNPKKPGFITRGTTLEAESSSSKQDSANYNEMTVSMLQGR